MLEKKLNNMPLFFNGITTGLSSQLAKELLKLGGKLFIADTNKLALELFLNNNSQQNNDFIIYQMKDNNSFQIETSVINCYNYMNSFNCAINNYIIPNLNTNILDCTIDYWNTIIRNSLTRFYSFLKYELSLMVGLKGGCIINTFNQTEEHAIDESHIEYTILRAIMGLTEITARTYSKNKINIYSFYPDINNLFQAESNTNIKIKNRHSAPEADNHTSAIKEILQIIEKGLKV